VSTAFPGAVRFGRPEDGARNQRWIRIGRTTNVNTMITQMRATASGEEPLIAARRPLFGAPELLADALRPLVDAAASGIPNGC
jgi:hypothetical protein